MGTICVVTSLLLLLYRLRQVHVGEKKCTSVRGQGTLVRSFNNVCSCQFTNVWDLVAPSGAIVNCNSPLPSMKERLQ